VSLGDMLTRPTRREMLKYSAKIGGCLACAEVADLLIPRRAKGVNTTVQLIGDTFQRPDGALGPSWGAGFAGNAPAIVNRGWTVDGTLRPGFSLWAGGQAIPNDQYARMTISALGPVGSDCLPRIGVRGNISGGGNCYYALAGRNTFDGNNDAVELWKLINGTAVFINGVRSMVLHVGDTIACAATETTISLLFNGAILAQGPALEFPSGTPCIGCDVGSGGINNPDQNTQATNFDAGSILVGGMQSDHFIRANGDIGPNWVSTSLLGGHVGQPGSIQIVNNSATGSSAAIYNASMWAQDIFSSDQFSQAVYLGPVPPLQAQGVAARINVAGSAYLLQVGEGFSTGRNYAIFSLIGGVHTKLGATGPLAAPGDTMRLEVRGSTLTMIINGVTQVVTSDLNLTFGQPGIASFGAVQGNFLSNWMGGTVDHQGCGAERI
jgi:hypothetical protein